MCRILPLFITGCLLGGGPAICQAPVAPIPTRFPAGAGVPKPFVTPPLGFAGGFRTPANGYVLPAYGGYYTVPSLFPFTNGFYPNYAVLPQGFAGGVGFGNGTVVNVTNNTTVMQGGSGQNGNSRVQPSYNVAASGESTATLVVALPSSGDVWLAGVKQKDSGALYTLTSPVLRAGEQYKYDVRAEWVVEGERVRAERTVLVSAGERQKLTLVLGDLIR